MYEDKSHMSIQQIVIIAQGQVRQQTDIMMFRMNNLISAVLTHMKYEETLLSPGDTKCNIIAEYMFLRRGCLHKLGSRDSSETEA